MEMVLWSFSFIVINDAERKKEKTERQKVREPFFYPRRFS